MGISPPGREAGIFLSAGEASGDLHGSFLVRALRRQDARARITCLGGPLLKDAGASVLVDNREIAVVGLFEVFRHLRAIYNGWRRIKGFLVQERPDIVVLIDFPDFNFMVAKLAKRLGITVLYYISPQVWAWRSGRVRTLKRFVDEMAVVLPFEPAFYERFGMKVHFVGHPLLDVLSSVPSREEALGRYGRDAGRPLVGLLPGSRRGEVRSLLPLLLDSAELLSDLLPRASFVVPVAHSIDREVIDAQVSCRRLPVRVVSGDTYGVIRACDMVIAASGTITLEAAILGTPMIIIYRVSNMSYYAGRHLIRVDHVGLPNLIAGSSIVPELLQDRARPELIAKEAALLLESPARLDRQRRSLEQVCRHLGAPGVADRVASLVMSCAGRGGSASHAPAAASPR